MDKEIDKNIGQKIIEFRNTFELSQSNLAKIMNITRQTLSQIELGTRSLKVKELIKISNYFKIPYKYFLILTP